MKSDFCKRMDGLCLQSPTALDTVRFKFNISCNSMRYQEENSTFRSLVRNCKALLRSNPTNNDLVKKPRRGTTTPISHSPTHLKQRDMKEDMKGDPGLTGMAFSTTSKTQKLRKSQVTLDLPTSQSCDEPFYRCRRLNYQHGEDAFRRYPMVRYSSSETGNVIGKLDLRHCGGKCPILGREIKNSNNGSEFQLISNGAQFHTRRKRGMLPLVESSF